MPTSQFSGPLHTFGFSTQQVSTPIPGARRPTCAAPCGMYHPLSHTARFDVVSSSVNIPRLAAALRDHPDCSLLYYFLYGCLWLWSWIQGAYHSWSSQEFTPSSFSPQGGHTAGTFDILPLPVLHVSPLGTVKNTHHITSPSHHPGSFFSPRRICQWWHQQTWVPGLCLQHICRIKHGFSSETMRIFS